MRNFHKFLLSISTGTFTTHFLRFCIPSSITPSFHLRFAMPPFGTDLNVFRLLQDSSGIQRVECHVLLLKGFNCKEKVINIRYPGSSEVHFQSIYGIMVVQVP